MSVRWHSGSVTGSLESSLLRLGFRIRATSSDAAPREISPVSA